jgi:4'-phosphopantetheinyl transferase
VNDTADRTKPYRSRVGADVCLWRAPLDLSESELGDLATCLSAEERQRADRYHRPADRTRFVAARGWLRHLLAGQLLCTPAEVRMVKSDRGKPRVAGSDLCFSAARSRGMAIYATSWRGEIGVDVEEIRPSADFDGLAERFFSPAEQRRLACLAPAQRMVATFQCWTCKEAYVKATGGGLRFPLHTVDTWVGRGRPALVSGWSIEPVSVAPGCVAAVATGVVRRAKMARPRLTPIPLDLAQRFPKKGGR